MNAYPVDYRLILDQATLQLQQKWILVLILVVGPEQVFHARIDEPVE